MFNWFKKKIELKNEDSIMTSSCFKNGIKIGSEIEIPSNFKCLIFNNGKYYFSLDSGKYKVSADRFERLLFAQSKTKRKRYVKMVCHYINLGTQSLTIRYKKQNYIVKFSIREPLDFANLILLYTYKVDNDYTLDTLHDIFTEGLTWLNGDYNKIDSEFFMDYGILVESFLPENKKQSIFNTSDNLLSKPAAPVTVDATPSTSTQPKEPIDPPVEVTEQEASADSQEKKIESPPDFQFNTCPKCKNVTKFNTTYCLRCGYKLE